MTNLPILTDQDASQQLDYAAAALKGFMEASAIHDPSAAAGNWFFDPSINLGLDDPNGQNANTNVNMNIVGSVGGEVTPGLWAFQGINGTVGAYGSQWQGGSYGDTYLNVTSNQDVSTADGYAYSAIHDVGDTFLDTTPSHVLFGGNGGLIFEPQESQGSVSHQVSETFGGGNFGDFGDFSGTLDITLTGTASGTDQYQVAEGLNDMFTGVDNAAIAFGQSLNSPFDLGTGAGGIPDLVGVKG